MCATLSGLWGPGDGVWGFVHSWEVTYHESYVSSLEDLSLISKLRPIYSLIRETGELLLITQGVPRGQRGALCSCLQSSVSFSKNVDRSTHLQSSF